MGTDTETSSESSQQPSGASLPRLGLCEVCAHTEARYTCPKCEVRTCSLPCLQIHKKELDCNGVRDKTRFIPIRDMTDRDFMSDYTFLEECTRYVADRKRDSLKRHTRFNKRIPTHLFRLRAAAHERQTTIRFLLPLFSRHAANSTRYDWKSQVIEWRIEWLFPNAAMARFCDARCDERRTLGELLAKYIGSADVDDAAVDEQVATDSDLIRKTLQFYRSRHIGQMHVLLKAEGVKRCQRRFWELDVTKTLRANLAGKTIVEFPVVYVMYDDVVKEFDVIDSDEDVARETELYQLELKTASKFTGAKNVERCAEVSGLGDDFRGVQLKKPAKHRKRTEQKPKNLLFTNEDEDEIDISSSDDDVNADDGGNETEEDDQEQQNGAKKNASKCDSETAGLQQHHISDDDEYENVPLDAKRARVDSTAGDK